MQTVFWISAFILFYAYIGYGLLLLVISMGKKKTAQVAADFFPPVTLIVPAYNEESIIEEKIRNCFSLDYPPQLLTLIFVTDGSTDATPELVSSHTSLVNLHQPERLGKSAALNRAMQVVKTPFVVFTDANAMLHPNSIQQMMQHFTDETIGGVSGEKRVYGSLSTAINSGEGIYWQYESMLKKADASFYTVIGAAGELFSIRTSLFEPLDEAIILDDFVLSARVCLKGYRFAYEPAAFALETASVTLAEERKRKVRISAGCFQAMVLLKGLLNLAKNWRLTFQYVSHRVLRWTICPLCVPLLFFAAALLHFQGAGSWYSLFFWLQTIFYMSAVAGWLFSEKTIAARFLFIPYYFVFMNLSLYAGFYRYLTGKQSVIWKKAVRQL